MIASKVVFNRYYRFLLIKIRIQLGCVLLYLQKMVGHYPQQLFKKIYNTHK